MREANLALLLVSLFVVKHFICDWWLQCSFPYQYKNKGRYGHPGGILHALIAGAGTFVTLWVYGLIIVPDHWKAAVILLLAISSKVWYAIAAEVVFHYHIDWCKVKLNNKLQLNMNENAGYWNLVGFDQMLHYLSYIGMAFFLLNNWC